MRDQLIQKRVLFAIVVLTGGLLMANPHPANASVGTWLQKLFGTTPASPKPTVSAQDTASQPPPASPLPATDKESTAAPINKPESQPVQDMMKCPLGEYPGINDLGIKSCIRPEPMRPTPTDTQFDRQPSGDFGQFQQGPSQEEMNRRQQEEEQRMKQEQERQEKERLRQMKNNMRGLEQGMNNIRKQIARLNAKKITVPQEVQTVMDELEAALKIVKEAQAMDDAVESAMETIADRGNELRDLGPMLGMIEQYPRALKDAERQLKNMVSQFTRAKRQAAKSKIDLSGAIAKVQTTIDEVNKSIAEAKSLAQSGEYEEAMETLRDGVFEASSDTFDQIRILEQLSNITRIFREVDRAIANYERTTNRLRAQKKDVSKLDELLGEMKQKRDEAKSIAATGDVDPESIFDILSGGEKLANDADEEIARLTNKPSTFQKNYSGSAPQFNFDPNLARPEPQP